MSFARISGLSLYYRVRGRGAPLLLLHGFAGSGGSWGGVLPSLERRWRVVVPDLIGHGRSAAPREQARYAFDRCVEDIAALLERLSAAPAHVVGYSMGGRLALALALRFPALVRSLVLEGVSPGIADPVEREARRARDEQLAREIETIGCEEFARRWLEQPLFASIRTRGPAMLARAVALRCTGTPKGLAGALRGLGPGVMAPLWERLGEVRAATLLVAGEYDSRYRVIAERMEAEMPSARVAVVAECGHCTHFEEPRRYLDAVESFLEEAERNWCETKPRKSARGESARSDR